MSAVSAESELELVITRVFDAPREQVFDAWTNVKHIAHWWGPKDFTVPSARMDAHAGGGYRACIRSPQGVEYWMHGVFQEIDRPSKLVFSWAWEDDNHETIITIHLDNVDGKTLMTFRQKFFQSVESRDSHDSGWSECFDRLQAWLLREHAKEAKQ